MRIFVGTVYHWWNMLSWWTFFPHNCMDTKYQIVVVGDVKTYGHLKEDKTRVFEWDELADTVPGRLAHHEKFASSPDEGILACWPAGACYKELLPSEWHAVTSREPTHFFCLPGEHVLQSIEGFYEKNKISPPLILISFTSWVACQAPRTCLLFWRPYVQDLCQDLNSQWMMEQLRLLEETWTESWNIQTMDWLCSPWCTRFIMYLFELELESHVAALKMIGPLFRAFWSANVSTPNTRTSGRHSTSATCCPWSPLYKKKKGGFVVRVKGRRGQYIALDKLHKSLINKDVKMNHPPNTVIGVLDFAENYACLLQEVQAAHATDLPWHNTILSNWLGLYRQPLHNHNHVFKELHQNRVAHQP